MNRNDAEAVQTYVALIAAADKASKKDCNGCRTDYDDADDKWCPSCLRYGISDELCRVYDRNDRESFDHDYLAAERLGCVDTFGGMEYRRRLFERGLGPDPYAEVGAGAS